ncbi:uncharacterized protein LOC123211634 [Mangifera indica]|uniref:uncharacterized protein LOC123211634 n=1 Tax=Mangifera indica TaxID=29780 RepID=UPI001CF9D32E|nr:uncharacterized protein LOC123211634 [Mangifera indica]
MIGLKIENRATKIPVAEGATLNQITSETLDARRLANFYKEIFGFEEIEAPNFAVEVIWLNLRGAFALHLIEKSSVTKLPEGPYSATSPVLDASHLPRSFHICFTRDKYESFVQTLQDKGIQTFQRSILNGKVKQIFFFDPDGNGLEVASKSNE